MQGRAEGAKQAQIAEVDENPMREIRSELENFTINCNELEEVVLELEQRLEDIMGPQEMGSNLNKEAGRNTAIGEKLSDENSRLCKIRERLVGILERIAI